MLMSDEQLYSKFGITILRQDEKFFLQYDSGEIVSKVKTIEISEREAKELKELENEHSVYEYMINKLNDRI